MHVMKIATAAFLLAAVSTSANALTITQASTIPTQTTDFTASFGTFNPFNTALGTLTSVTAVFTATAQDSGTLKNNSSGPQTFSFATNNSTYISAGPAPLQTAFGGASPLSFSSLTATYTNLAAGASAPFPQSGSNGFTASPQSKTSVFTSASDLSAFESGTFTASMSTLTGQTFSGGGGNIAATLSTTEGGSLTITYNYTPPAPPSVPEPSTLAALGVGLVGLAFIRSRNSKA